MMWISVFIGMQSVLQPILRHDDVGCLIRLKDVV